MDILIVDDEKIITDSLQLILKDSDDYGMILVADDGEEAIKKLEEYQFDIVVVDINMPNVDGLSLVKHIRHNLTNHPEIIMISGGFTTENVQIAADFNIQYTLAKPFNAKNFITKLDSVIKDMKRAQLKKSRAS